MLARTGVHDHRSSHHHDLSTLVTNAPQFPGNLLDHQLDAALAGNTGAHEAKLVGAGRFPAIIAALRIAHGADAFDAHYDLIAGFQIAHQTAMSSSQVRCPTVLDHDYAV